MQQITDSPINSLRVSVVDVTAAPIVHVQHLHDDLHALGVLLFVLILVQLSRFLLEWTCRK